MTRKTCAGCKDGVGFATPFSMAFQPIVDTTTGEVFAYEALVRGTGGEGAQAVLSQVTAENRYAFDQACRVKAIEVASRLGVPARGAGLSINFLPNAVYEPSACIRLTLETARATGFPTDRLIFEFIETEELDPEHVGRIVSTYREMGFLTAIDDFGSGYSGLNLLSRFQPDIVKLDMELVRRIDVDRVKRAIVNGIVRVCADIGVVVLGEGVETADESRALADLGVALQQGYAFARPAFEALPDVALPAASSGASEVVLAAWTDASGGASGSSAAVLRRAAMFSASTEPENAMAA